MPGIDDPLDVVKKQYPEKLSGKRDLMLELILGFLPGGGIINALRNHLSNQDADARTNAFLQVFEAEFREIYERLKNIPPERIIEPNPAIVIPVFEALPLVANEPDLRQMYANLIATSMDSKTDKNAHPAFVETIRQMVADEAKIFSTIAAERDRLVNISQVQILRTSYDIAPPDVRYAYLTKKSKCESPALIPVYLDNLQRLKLTQHDTDGWHYVTYHPDGTITSNKKESLSHPAPADDIGLITIIKSIVDAKFQDQVEMAVELSAYYEIVYLTAFGRQFANACVFPSN